MPVFSLIETGYRVILVALLVALRRDDKGTRRTVSVLLKDRSAVMRKAVGLLYGKLGVGPAANDERIDAGSAGSN